MSAFIGAGGLGQFINRGLALSNMQLILLGAIFIFAGANHVVHWQSAAARMTANGMAMEDVLGGGGEILVHAMLALAVVLMLAGGLSVVLGVFARFGALMLLAFLIPTTLIFHDFWMLSSDTALQQQEMIHFMKNLGLMGGLLMVFAFGSGGLTAEVLLPRRRKTGEF